MRYGRPGREYTQVGEGEVGHDAPAVVDHGDAALVLTNKASQGVGHGLCVDQTFQHTPAVAAG